MKYVHWLLMLIFWDGVLPALVMLSPAILRLFVPKHHLAEALVNVALPILFFLIRCFVGQQRLASISPTGRPQRWREAFFYPALFILLLWETLAMVVAFTPEQARGVAWLALGGMYLLYLLLMAIALFPTHKTPPKPEPENPWASLVEDKQ